MPRLFIDISDEEHRRLKASAALQGQTIQEYVLECSLPPEDEEPLQELEAFLRPRIEEAERGEFSQKTFDEMKQEARKKISS